MLNIGCTAMAEATMKRISASVPDVLFNRLEKLAEHEGRSFSNLVAHLLERNLEEKLSGYVKVGEEKPDV
jgi:metal-responsive CopG/Arc/MetJ family transcriptional regulator